MILVICIQLPHLNSCPCASSFAFRQLRGVPIER